MQITLELENLRHILDVLQNHVNIDWCGLSEEEAVQIMWKALLDSLQEKPPF